jgi:hypothetical protein
MTRIQANLPRQGFARITITNRVITVVERDGAEQLDVPFCAPGLVDIQSTGLRDGDPSTAETSC